MSARVLTSALICLLANMACTSAAKVQADPFDTPQDYARGCEAWDDWRKPAPVFLIHGATFYVGSCGITSLLVLTDDNAVLLDTAEQEFVPTLLANIARLGTKPADVGWILGSHEHYDHLGGLASMQRETGARIIAAEQAVAALTGRPDPRDPQFAMHDALDPVTIAQTASNGDAIDLGGIVFTAMETPGHTPGAMSWSWESCDAKGCKSIVYADSLTPIGRDDYRFSDHPKYVAAYRAGLQRLREADCDILLTPHPSASRMIERAATGTLVGGMTCAEYADSIEARLDKRLTDEAGGR